MSVEAISWALNLAPVPRDRGGKRNPACKAVLTGLANHAGPDGRDAFPSVATLMRYTELSERTVRTALDRLQAARVITACDPGVVAAKIRRADQRPQGWDLGMHLVRDDLDAGQMAGLERQFPGLTARVAALRAGVAGQPDGGVQQLHPVFDGPVDNEVSGVQLLHPAGGTGCSQHANGVQPAQQRGATAAPEPSIEPPVEPPATPAHTREPGTALALAAEGGGGIEEFFSVLGRSWPLTTRQRDRLAGRVAEALANGWTSAGLAETVGANTAGVRNPFAILRSRLSPGELPPPSRRPARPPWCGSCDEQTRMVGYDGDSPSPCPRCKPGARRYQHLQIAGHAASGRDSVRPWAYRGIMAGMREEVG